MRSSVSRFRARSGKRGTRQASLEFSRPITEVSYVKLTKSRVV